MSWKFLMSCALLRMRGTHTMHMDFIPEHDKPEALDSEFEIAAD